MLNKPVVGVDMQRLTAEADHTLRRIREFATREELKMGDDLGDSGTLPTTIPDLLQRVLQKFGEQTGTAFRVNGENCLSEREESPQGFTGVLDFDPAYPEVFFLMVKWYWKPPELSDTLLQLYPPLCGCVCTYLPHVSLGTSGWLPGNYVTLTVCADSMPVVGWQRLREMVWPLQSPGESGQ